VFEGRAVLPSSTRECPEQREKTACVPEQLSQAGLALYRKHRPAGFDELVGQQAVVQGLQSAVASGRVAHAYLFSGPRGTGKTSAARILAKCLNCLTNGPRPDPCGICEACVSIADGTAFDVVEIDGASNNSVDNIRELREKINYAPSRFRTKVYIIDEVHMLSSGAFNALLKTLEEPPEHVVFVLATTEVHKVPVTIQSRCQRYEFRRMTPADIAKRLTDVASIERIKIAPEAVARIAYLADGALRDALVLLDQARGFADGGRIDDQVLDDAFGASHRELIERIVDAVSAADAGEALRAVADAVAVGADPAWITKECLRWFRLALLGLVGTELLDGEVAPEEALSIGERAAKLGKSKVLTALRYLSETAAQRFSPQPRIDLELALARIILPGEELSMRAFSDRLRVLEEGSGPRSGAPPDAAPPVPARTAPKKESKRSTEASSAHVEPPINTARLSGLWPMVLSAVRQRSMQAFGHLQHASVADASDELVTIWVDDKFNRDRLADAGMSALVAESIAQASGSRPSVRFVLAQPSVVKPVPAPSGLALAADVLGDDMF
jgi:DNA polymerase-3 subunit gamma/tau